MTKNTLHHAIGLQCHWQQQSQVTDMNMGGWFITLEITVQYNAQLYGDYFGI